jgi:hypothetical protein
LEGTLDEQFVRVDKKKTPKLTIHFHRAVVMIGLPFANLASAALVEKIKYVKEHTVSFHTATCNFGDMVN